MKAVFQTSALGLLVLLTVPFALYAVNFAQGGMRDALPESHYIRSDNVAANLSIFAHMAAGAILTVLVPLQLVAVLRRRLPRVHRWSGRVLIGAAIVAALGGLVYIPLRGTIGGMPMDIGFAGYGALILVTAVQTLRHARAGRMRDHNAWALRFFWLAIGSWLYRVHYGLWYAATGGLWSNPTFTGGFDLVQNFAFYVPYLIGVELFLWRRRRAEAILT